MALFTHRRSPAAESSDRDFELSCCKDHKVLATRSNQYMIANVNLTKEQAENGRQRNECVRILIRWHLESKRPLSGHFSEIQTEPLDFWVDVQIAVT
jgi:hypothetical protein